MCAPASSHQPFGSSETLSLGIQITLKRDARCSPKQMVICMGHWKHGRIQPLHGSPPGPRQAVARLVTHGALAYFAKPPRSGCQHGIGKAIQGGTAAAEVPEHLQKVSCFSSSWWERPQLGKQSPPGGTFKTASLQKGLQGFCF